MSEIDEIFKNALKVTQKKRGKFTIMVGTVKEVESDTCTVDDYEDVRLNGVVDDLNSQFTVYPKIGSKVIIAMLENESDMFVVRVSEVEKVTIKINDQLFEMKEGKFTIKSGNVNLKAILNNAFEKLKTAIITTPSGPGQFSPSDKLAFENYKTQVNQLLM
jgi:hypothetical protein